MIERANGTLAVLADDIPTDSNYREKVLRAANPNSIVIKCEDVIGKTAEQLRAETNGKEVVYIYHDTIDAASHASDSMVFPACETAIQELKMLIRHATNKLNRTHVFVTADHGFLYTYKPLKEDSKIDKTSFNQMDVEYGRRYAIMREGAAPDYLMPVRFMDGNTGLTAFTPRESMRIKMQGGGLNFVHGGVSLQELCVPLIAYHRLRNEYKEYQRHRSKYDMLIVQDQVWGRVTANRAEGKSTRYYMDEFHLLLKEEQTAAYSVEIWKRFRKWGGIPTGITQNVKDLLASQEIENIFENSDYIYMLNQAAGDREILAKKLGISPHQLSYPDADHLRPQLWRSQRTADCHGSPRVEIKKEKHMQLRREIKRLAALVLAMNMALGCMPVSAWAEATTPTDLPPIIATDGEAVPEPTLPSDEQEAEQTDDEPAPEDWEVPDESDGDSKPAADDPVSEQEESADDNADDMPADNPQGDDAQDALPDEPADASEEENENNTPAEEAEPDNRLSIQAALDEHGHVYVATVHKAAVYSDAAMTEESLVYTTTEDVFLVLATEFAAPASVKVWFLSETGEVICGYRGLGAGPPTSRVQKVRRLPCLRILRSCKRASLPPYFSF